MTPAYITIPHLFAPILIAIADGACGGMHGLLLCRAINLRSRSPNVAPHHFPPTFVSRPPIAVITWSPGRGSSYWPALRCIMTDRARRPPSSTSSSQTATRNTQQGASYAATAAGSADRSLAWDWHSTIGEELRRREEQRVPVAVVEARRRQARGSMDIDGSEWDRNGSGSQSTARPAWRGDRLGCTLHDDHPPFFIPSYLRRSRHVHRLQREHERHVAELKERAHLHPSTPAKSASLSTSSSHANLSKMHGTHMHHRPAVQDVIERIPPHAEEDPSHPLPSRWSDDEKMPGLEVMAEGMEVRFVGPTFSTKNDSEAASTRADHPMPKEVGLYYYEVTVLTRGKEGGLAVGFSTRSAQLNRLPGWEAESWAYHSDDGSSFTGASTGKTYGPEYGSQDVIGCGVNFKTGNAFFTKNGVFLGNAFTGIKSDHIYPSVGIKKAGEQLRVNFGRTPFVFDIDQHMENEFSKAMDEINDADVTVLHHGDHEDTLIEKLVRQYLAHEGYIETAKAFTRDTQSTSANTSAEAPEEAQSDDDIHAINRQKIRKSILDGDIDRALKYTNTYYPHVLGDERNKDVYFRLRCRKFIEMMRQYSDLIPASPGLNRSTDPRAHSPNGHNAANGHDTQMELDDQMLHETSDALPPPSSDDVDMDVSQELPAKPTSSVKQNQLLGTVLTCGQELQQEFGGDTRAQVKKHLHDLFAIIAYTNPAESPMGTLLDPKGRMQIAEDVNGAILGRLPPPSHSFSSSCCCGATDEHHANPLTSLVSLGKPSSAALEKLCAQTEVLLDATAYKTGGAAAFVDVRKDLFGA
nr:ran-binding protein 9 [Quercus suber]